MDAVFSDVIFMNRSKIKVLLLLLSGIGCFAAAVCGAGFSLRPASGGDSSSLLAEVNGQPITVDDVLPMTQAKEYQAYAALSGAELERAILRLRREAVETLIDRKLIVADYRAGNSRLSDNDIERELDNAAERAGCRSRSAFIRKLRENGISIEKFRTQLEEQMAVQLMYQREYYARNFVTPADILRYYEAHREDFDVPERVELAMLRIPASHAEKELLLKEVSRDLAADPESFAAVAGRVSDAPAAASGGSLGWIEVRRLRQEFAAALKSGIEKDRIYGPIATAEGVVFLRVNGHEAGSAGDFSGAAPEIRRILEEQIREKSRQDYRSRLRSEAFVKYYIEDGGRQADKKNIPPAK